MKRKWLAPVMLALMVLAGALAYPLLPRQVPSHWNAAGEIDGYASRLWGVVLVPALTFGIWLLLLAVPKIDPRKANYAQFAGTYQLIINLLVVFMAVVYGTTLLAGLGVNIAINRIVGLLTGLLFVGMGNELGRVAPNFFVGVRTPWTLADPEVWRRTHRVAGRAMVIAGFIILVAALVLPNSMLIGAILTGTLGFAAVAIGYSYIAWQQVLAKE